MKLQQLCADLVHLEESENVEIHGLSQDSRTVKEGYLFLAILGHAFDGRNYIKEACEKGAAAVLFEEEEGSFPNIPASVLSLGIPLIPIKNLSQHVSKLAAGFYDFPSEKMNVVGVTGTNGKTTTTHFIAQLLTELGSLCGVMGTIGMGYPGKIKENASLTTADPVTLQRNLRAFYEDKAQSVAMEVSSHALDQGRVKDVRLKIGIFTNLTQDHLDYHKTMGAYGLAKRKLFLHPGLEKAIINVDSPFGRGLAQEFREKLPVITISCRGFQEEFRRLSQCLAKEISYNPEGISATIQTLTGEAKIQTHFYGLFNLYNLLSAIACVESLGHSLGEIVEVLGRIRSVPGRMEKLGGGGKPTVIVDYAHTPDALEQTLLAIKRHNRGKIYCIFGCGGDRDSSKRPFMGKIAQSYSDQCIVTNDNPRGEIPERIAEDILSGMNNPKGVLVELDRQKAIFNTLGRVNPQDIILIAGKGHEDYQEIQGVKLPFSDKEQVLMALEGYNK